MCHPLSPRFPSSSNIGRRSLEEALRKPSEFVEVDTSKLMERPQAAADKGASTEQSQASKITRQYHSTTPSQLTPHQIVLPPLPSPGSYQSSYPLASMTSFPTRYPHQYVSPFKPLLDLPPLSATYQDQNLLPQDSLSTPNLHPAWSERLASEPPSPEHLAKRKPMRWSAEEDAAIIEMRGNNMKWEDISRSLPGRSAISCRLRFQNYLERRSEWDEEKKTRLARLYERFKKDMWEKIAKEMALPWRAAEAMHWQIGEAEMANRASVPVFYLAKSSALPLTETYLKSTASPIPISSCLRHQEDASTDLVTEGDSIDAGYEQHNMLHRKAQDPGEHNTL